MNAVLEARNTLPPALQERIAGGDLFFATASEACAFQSQQRQHGTLKPTQKLPCGHRWPNAVRDDELAWLLALNACSTCSTPKP